MVDAVPAAAGIKPYVPVAGRALDHARGEDLGYEAARRCAGHMRPLGVGPGRAMDALNLGGFLNGSGNRTWYRQAAIDAGGWR